MSSSLDVGQISLELYFQILRCVILDLWAWVQIPFLWLSSVNKLRTSHFKFSELPSLYAITKDTISLRRVTKWYNLYKDGQSILFTSAVHGSFTFCFCSKSDSPHLQFYTWGLGTFHWKIFWLEIENSKNINKWARWEAHSVCPSRCSRNFSRLTAAVTLGSKNSSSFEWGSQGLVESTY